MRPILSCAVAGIIALANLSVAFAASVLPEEMAEKDAWTAAKFRGKPVEPSSPPGISVLANHGPVGLNARDGQPLRIAGKQYSHGLYCHAVSQVLVRLPGPAKAFSAIVGVDTNGNFGGGSIVFVVSAEGSDIVTSPVMHRGEAGLAVNADLQGASEFTLSVTDAGDNINSDQAAWAEATVTLMDGRTIRVGDMPLSEFRRGPYTPLPPFSFLYGDRAFPEMAADWPVERSEKALDSQRTERTVSFKDPETGLAVRCVGVEYSDYPTVEWTVYLRNNGNADTPIISNVRALDCKFEGNGQGTFMLHHWNGTWVNRSDYEPHQSEIKAGETRTFSPRGGRPCAAEFPYYNLEWGGEGVVAAIGWPGQWTAQFSRDSAEGVTLAAGQELTRFKLMPGEEVRTPLIVLQFWKGDVTHAQNVWRRWMFAHSLPRRNGGLPAPQMPAVSGNQFPGLLCNEADEIRYIDRFAEEGVKITHWWMDAGWYVNKGDWTSVGTWEVDKARFPRGIRAVADHAHAKGLQLIVWFEPERVTAGSWLADNHPEWVLGGKEGGLLNLGHPEAWKWLVDCYDRIITEEGIDYYRQDFNMDPLRYWRANDTDERQGITEIRHVEGYLAFWDELVRRHPGMMIDSCASGGHRNDLETLRRSVPLLRSDYIFDWTGEQCHTYGFASWVPYWGTGLIDFDAYSFRSCMGLDTTLSCDARRKDLDWGLLRKLTEEWRAVVPYFQGDYYPITKYSQEDDVWMAWQFDVPEKGEGMVQAFRRPNCIYESARLKLKSLEPDTTYVVTNLDDNTPREAKGRELMETGLAVPLPAAPGSAIVTYKARREG